MGNTTANDRNANIPECVHVNPPNHLSLLLPFRRFRRDACPTARASYGATKGGLATDCDTENSYDALAGESDVSSMHSIMTEEVEEGGGICKRRCWSRRERRQAQRHSNKRSCKFFHCKGRTTTSIFLFLVVVVLSGWTLHIHLSRLITHRHNSVGNRVGGAGGKHSRVISQSNNNDRNHAHALPTLLSIMDFNKDGMQFVNALTNPLYSRLHESFHFHERPREAITSIESQLEQPKKDLIELKVDSNLVKYHDSLTIHWRVENDALRNQYQILEQQQQQPQQQHEQQQEQPFVHDDDVIALYCPANEPNVHKFRDAASIRQIRATTQLYRTQQRTQHQHGDEDKHQVFDTEILLGDSTNNKWYIPKFPILREETCEFRLLSRHSTDEKVNRRTLNDLPPNSSINMGYVLSGNEKSEEIPSFQLIGRSDVIHIINGRMTPTGIHLALTERADEMIVHFTTGIVHGAKPVALIWEKTNKAALSWKKPRANPVMYTGNSSTYSASDLCGAPANIEEAGKFVHPGALHVVTMKGLKPRTKYYYRVGLFVDKEVPMWSSEHTFVSPLVVGGADHQPFSFVVYADQGVPQQGFVVGSERTRRMVEREINLYGISAVHHFGDLSYAKGAGKGYLYLYFYLVAIVLHRYFRLNKGDMLTICDCS